MSATESHSPHSDFTRWAHDPARSIDDRYLVWLLCDQAGRIWHWRLPPEERKDLPSPLINLQHRKALNLNPALAAAYSVIDTERAAEVAPFFKVFDPHISVLGDKPIHDAGALRFFPALETVKLGASQLNDLTWVTDLPRLRVLQVKSGALENLAPLAAATGLRDLSLLLESPIGTHFAPPFFWPDVSSLAALVELETLVFGPNAAALRGIRFPALRVARLSCTMQPDCHCLPDMPELRVLELRGVQSLRGIGRFPNLRNLIIRGPLRDFGDLTELRHLTALEVDTEFGWPREVGPVAALRELRYARFGNDGSKFRGEVPRNYWPLAGAPRLRLLEAPGAIGIELDLQAIQAALTLWDEDFLAPVPRPVPPLRFVARKKYHLMAPSSDVPHPDRPADPEMFYRELLWMHRRCRERLVALTGYDDTVGTHPPSNLEARRYLSILIESQELADLLPEAVDALRQCLAESPHEWHIDLRIQLRVPDRLFTEQQKHWLKQIETGRTRRDEEREYEMRRAARRHEIDATHRVRTAIEEGEMPEPADFAPPEEIGPTGWGKPVTVAAGGGSVDSDDEDDEEDDDIPEDFRLCSYDEHEKDEDDEAGDTGDIAVKVDYGPPDWFINNPNEHPLAWTCRTWGILTLDTFCVATDILPTAESLMRRPVDEVIGKPPSTTEQV